LRARGVPDDSFGARDGSCWWGVSPKHPFSCASLRKRAVNSSVSASGPFAWPSVSFLSNL